MKKAEVRPAQLGWLTSLGALPGNLVRKGFHGPLSTGPVGEGMPHAMGEWGWGGVRTLLFSPISASQPELGQRPYALSPIPLSPHVLRSQFPDPSQDSRIGIHKQQTHTKTGFPCTVKRVIFILFPFWLIVVMCASSCLI